MSTISHLSLNAFEYKEMQIFKFFQAVLHLIYSNKIPKIFNDSILRLFAMQSRIASKSTIGILIPLVKTLR